MSRVNEMHQCRMSVDDMKGNVYNMSSQLAPTSFQWRRWQSFPQYGVDLQAEQTITSSLGAPQLAQISVIVFACSQFPYAGGHCNQ